MTDPLGPPLATDSGALMEFAVEGHREIAPIVITEKRGPVAVRGAQGIYRVGRHRGDGGLVLLFSMNPDCLDPRQVADAEARERWMPGYCLSLMEEDLRYVQVVEGRRRWTNAPWIQQAVQRHSRQLFQDTTEYAYLWRVDARLWTSGAIGYRLETIGAEVTAEDKAKFERKLKHPLPEREPGEPLYRLRCYTTGGKNQDFVDFDGEFLRRPWGRALTAASRWTIVTMREAESIIADDFVKRQELVIRGFDPDKLGRPLRKTEPRMKSRLSPHELPLSAALGKRYFARGIQECYGQFRRIEGKSVVMSTAKAIALAGSKLALRGPVPALGRLALEVFRPIAQPLAKAFGQSEQVDFRREDTARAYWRPHFTEPRGPDHYAPLDPAQAPYIRLLDAHEARVAPEAGATVREELSDAWAENKLLDSLGGPPGSIVSRHRPEGAGTDLLHVRQPDGLRVDYVIGKEIAYARYDPSAALASAPPLPERIARLFRKHDASDGTRVLRIHETGAGEFEVAAYPFDEAYERALRDDAREAAESAGRLPQPDHEISPELRRVWQKADRRRASDGFSRKAWKRICRCLSRKARAGEGEQGPKLTPDERAIWHRIRERRRVDAPAE